MGSGDSLLVEAGVGSSFPVCAALVPMRRAEERERIYLWQIMVFRSFRLLSIVAMG
jgi:hypothetical protein